MTTSPIRDIPQLAPGTDAVAPRVGDPAYSLLGLAAGTLVQAGTRATPAVSTMALARRSVSAGPVA
jgi:hypothetical protein